MTLHVYNCETSVIHTEMVKRTKDEGTFYGLRLHMNTDQAITFWSRTEAGLQTMAATLAETLTHPYNEEPTIPGQPGRGTHG
jgi:hypothetical protein